MQASTPSCFTKQLHNIPREHRTYKESHRFRWSIRDYRLCPRHKRNTALSSGAYLADRNRLISLEPRQFETVLRLLLLNMREIVVSICCQFPDTSNLPRLWNSPTLQYEKPFHFQRSEKLPRPFHNQHTSSFVCLNELRLQH